MQKNTETELKEEDSRPVEATPESDKSTASKDSTPKIGSGIFMNQFETSL